MSYEKTYSEMMSFNDFSDRLEYLRLKGIHHESPRDISNKFYKSKPWLDCREDIMRRDLGCDLGVVGIYIDGPMTVHHINPITQEDIETQSEKLYDPENLITVSDNTHKIIHYRLVEQEKYIERSPGDTKLW